MNSRELLGKAGKGAKAGAIPGAIVGVLSIPLNYYLLGIKYNYQIALALFLPYYSPSLTGLIGIAISTTVVLTVCGILYAFSYEKLPGKAFWKAFIFGLAIYLISRIGDLMTDYPVSPGLTIDNALLSAPLFLLLYPYLMSKLYS